MSEGWSVCFSHNNQSHSSFYSPTITKNIMPEIWLADKGNTENFPFSHFVDLRPKVNVTFHVIGKNQTTEQWGEIEMCRSHYITVFPPKIRHTHKISRSRISKHLHNISPTLKIRPSDRRGYAVYRRGAVKKMAALLICPIVTAAISEVNGEVRAAPSTGSAPPVRSRSFCALCKLRNRGRHTKWKSPQYSEEQDALL